MLECVSETGELKGAKNCYECDRRLSGLSIRTDRRVYMADDENE